MTTDTPTLTAEAVAEFLALHPDFFEQRHGLLDQLIMPVKDHGAGVADMQQYMLDRLREEIDRLRGCTSELIANSRINMTNTDRTHRAVLALLEAKSFAGFVESLQDELPIILDIDVAALCFEQASRHQVPRVDGRIRELGPGSVNAVLGVSEDIWLVADNAGDKAIFGPASDLVRSAAILRIEPFDQQDGPKGLLAFGSRTPELFHPTQGTDLLAFLGTVVEHMTRRWLGEADRALNSG